ncbi:MAG: hypothetical protein EB165_04655 [Euryarchaeota archaeon]|nr:hypothetical protein [Euryarchaeota archaeon]
MTDGEIRSQFLRLVAEHLTGEETPSLVRCDTHHHPEIIILHLSWVCDGRDYGLAEGVTRFDLEHANFPLLEEKVEAMVAKARRGGALETRH